MTKRFGFTLAEVLITLGIIGVVAAMTIPTLISNTNGAQFKTAYKKALSTLNQAILMNIAMEDTDFSTIVADDADSGTKMSDILTNRMQSPTDITTSYFQTVDTMDAIEYTGDVTCTAGNIVNTAENTSPCKGKQVDDVVTGSALSFTPSSTNVKVFSFADGTSFAFNVDAENCTDSTKGAADNDCIGFIDVNGSTGPNKVVTCDTNTKEGGTGTEACTVDSSAVTDIYPVYFHGQTVEPATDAARAVLFGK